MAAFTTFAAGFSMTLSSLTAFRQMGQFLMTISRLNGASVVDVDRFCVFQCSPRGCLPRSSSCHSAPSSVQWAIAGRYPSCEWFVASNDAAVVMVAVQEKTLVDRTAALSCHALVTIVPRRETSTCPFLRHGISSAVQPLIFLSLSAHQFLSHSFVCQIEEKK